MKPVSAVAHLLSVAVLIFSSFLSCDELQTDRSAALLPLGIEITPTGPVMSAGKSGPLSAVEVYPDGKQVDITAQAIWSVSDTVIAQVSNDDGNRGMVSALVVGNTEVSIQYSKFSASTTLTVVDGDVIVIGQDNQTLTFQPELQALDVFFILDTTQSMDGELNYFKTYIGDVFSSVSVKVAGTAFGLGKYDDIFCSTFGSAGDIAFQLRQSMTTNITLVQSAAASLNAAGGNDIAESGYEALYQAASGAGLSVPSCSVSLPAYSGEGLGGGGFREGALPFIVWMTDAPSHDDYYLSGGDLLNMARKSDAIAALTDAGIRVISIVSGSSTEAIGDCLSVSSSTGAVLTADYWGSAVDRPAGCAVDQCCTGVNFAGENTVGGECALAYKVADTGVGLPDAAEDGIKKLSRLFGRVSATVVDDPTDGIDVTTAFLNRVEADITDGLCLGMDTADTNGDTMADSYEGVEQGQHVCFQIRTSNNEDTVSAGSESQLFKATLQISGDGNASLGTKDLYFVVPALSSL